MCCILVISTQLTRFLGEITYYQLMDPRRARDPRLARADPRLQHTSSGSPAPVPQALPPQAQQQQWIENGVQNYATPPPVQNNLQPSQPPVTSAPPPIQAPLQPEYRQKPLFCVVCASNQVSKGCPGGGSGTHQILPRIVPWRAIPC